MALITAVYESIFFIKPVWMVFFFPSLLFLFGRLVVWAFGGLVVWGLVMLP